ncbi:MAG: hypothetical protein IBX57_00350 [Gammaproteobacteria bacterium]|nr:hypothetical protein [Gammaproteobacteria bacterium]
MSKEIAKDIGLAFVAKLPDLIRDHDTDSLIEFTKPTRVEPIVLLDDKVVNLSYTPDILQSLTNIFAGYYLQAVALSVNVGNVNVIGLLDRLNPNRDFNRNAAGSVINSSLRTAFESAEAYEHGLPVPGQPIGLEHFGIESDRISSSKDSIKLAMDVNNLSTGKLLEVEIESEGKKATFPIALRVIPTSAPSDGIVHLLSLGRKDKSVKERWHAWRSGQIEFIRDFVFAQDLIDDHKKGLIKDTTGLFEDSLKRRSKNFLSTVLSGNVSVATASNIIVITESTKKAIERNIGGRIKDFKTREAIFKTTYTMLLVVVDPEWEAVTIYHRSIETPTEVSASDMKNPKKGNDITDILKAYQLGNSPSL